ncbi:MAG TPA: nucleotidyltransferase domain-containing protein [Roseiflexaceae bacterium]|nr:nucleotidyltransferase domain-containing protein [Roseiflexaceae bacterium]
MSAAGNAALPGTPQQQRLLRAIAQHYARDPRVRAVVVFGSLGQGTWDQYSDLDLDVVTTDDADLLLSDEIERLTTLLASCDESIACVDPDGEVAVDLMLLSLIGVSLRFHPLHATPPEILGSLHVLAGTLDTAAIRAAGQANQQHALAGQGSGVDQFLRLAVEVDIALQRAQFWRAIQCLQLMRNLALSAYALTHGGARPFYFFQTNAPAELEAILGATLPQHSLASAQAAFGAMLDLAEHHLATLTNGMITMSDIQRDLIRAIRARQADLQAANGR